MRDVSMWSSGDMRSCEPELSKFRVLYSREESQPHFFALQRWQPFRLFSFGRSERKRLVLALELAAERVQDSLA